MRRRRLLWPLISAIVILCQLAQPLGLVPAAAGQTAAPAGAPPQSLAGPAPVAASLPDTQAQAARPAWLRPSVASIAAPALTPPRLPAPDSVAAPQGGPPPFPYGNNNFGQSYFDITNPDMHPGRHFAGPVNLINGNLFLTVGDAFFAARGLSVEFARSYNSLDSRNGPLGPGWTHTYNNAVITSTVITTAVPGEVVVIRGGDGTLYTYTYTGAFWQPPAGYYRILQHNSVADPFILRDKSGLVETYDPSGRLRQTVDRNNNQLAYGYDLSGNLTSITDTSGVRSLTLSYNPVSNTLQSLTDPLGRVTNYLYNGSGRLSQVNYPEGSHATYTYDGSGLLVGYSDPRQPAGTISATISYEITGNRPITVSYGTGSFFDIFYSGGGANWNEPTVDQRIAYDSFYNVTQDETAAGGFHGDQWNYPTPANLLPLSKTDANGNVTQYAYDALGNVTLVTDPTGATTRFLYEPTHNNVISTTNPLGNTTRYSYDANGNLVREIDPLGHELTYTVDLNGGNLLGTTDSAGRHTTYTYDPSFGNLVGVIDPSGLVITHTYDAVGRVMQTVDPSGRATVYQYDNADRLVTLTDPLSGTLQYTYDSHSNLTRVVDPEGEIITHTYDSLDRLIRVTDALSHSTQYQYDDASRLALRTDATGATTTYGYDGASRLIQRFYSGGAQDQFTYDTGGRLIGMTDGTISTTIAYDAASRPMTITLTAPGFTGPTRAIYAYDPMGNRTGDVLQDSSGHTWQTLYQYDALGRLTQTTDNASRLWTTTYDAKGCRATRTLPDGSYELYTYDAGCRLLQLQHHKADTSLIRSFVYAYDSRGNLLSEQDGTQTSAYTYDALSRLATANTPQGLTSHTYGPSSERLTSSGPGGLTTTYHYDDAGHLTGTNDTTYQYDAMGRRVSQTGPGGSRTYGYDGEMRLNSFFDVFANVSLDYDPLGQLVHKQGGSGGNTYYLNGAGRLEAELTADGALSRTYTVDTEIVALNLIGAGSVDYHYDGRGRVRWVTGAGGNTIAAYGTDPTVTNDNFYNPIRVAGSYYFPELNLYLIGDGQFWDPWSGTFIFRAWPWVFWPFGPFSAWHAIFRYWPWPWLWPRPWAWPWPRPWAWQWPWPGVWVRPWLIWPLWPWPVQPFWPWWWWWHWWGWPAWGHWWQWQWWGWLGWWWNWAWWGGWWWPWWWWPWWWWWPCWWMWWAWWGWWGWWWWWGWCWWWWGWWWWWWSWWPWWWSWGWWWIPWYWVPYLPRPPDYGDAPDPLYPSLLAHNGARHLNPTLEWLGPGYSREYDARLSNLDTFDDGVVVNLTAGVITFTVNTAGYLSRYGPATPVHVHGWIDWNGDGNWTDPNEFVLDWSGYPGGPGWPALAISTTITVPITVPTGLPLLVWSRFRLDYNQDLSSPVGPARYGEVEDYALLTRAHQLFLPLIRR